MPMPADANQNGDIFGGWIMAQVDIAGGLVASRLARGRVATVAVKEFVFKQPVQIGDLLSFYVELQRIGRTSLTVTVVPSVTPVAEEELFATCNVQVAVCPWVKVPEWLFVTARTGGT